MLIARLLPVSYVATTERAEPMLSVDHQELSDQRRRGQPDAETAEDGGDGRHPAGVGVDEHPATVGEATSASVCIPSAGLTP
jgi:hypothetical protein